MGLGDILTSSGAKFLPIFLMGSILNGGGMTVDTVLTPSSRVKYFYPNFFQIVYISHPKRFQIKDPNTLGFRSKDRPGPRCRGVFTPSDPRKQSIFLGCAGCTSTASTDTAGESLGSSPSTGCLWLAAVLGPGRCSDSATSEATRGASRLRGRTRACLWTK